MALLLVCSSVRELVKVKPANLGLINHELYTDTSGVTEMISVYCNYRVCRQCQLMIKIRVVELTLINYMTLLLVYSSVRELVKKSQ